MKTKLKKMEKCDNPFCDNPFCAVCQEKDCEISFDGTCKLLRIYLKAKREAK